MSLIIGPEKNNTLELNISEEGPQRILIGLSWNPNELSKKQMVEQTLSGIRDVVCGGLFLLKTNVKRIHEKIDLPERDEKDQNFDLDLSCFAFDSDQNFLSLVDPSAWNAIDESGKIYHSGDNQSGMGGVDDEQIYIELKDLPEKISEFFIVVQSDCAHSFKDVHNPQIRVADSKTNADLLAVRIDEVTGSDAYGFVFCRIFKNNDKWMAQNISDFCAFEENWTEFLKKYRS